MKKILSIIISVVFILGLFSCTTTTPNTTTKIQIKVEENVLTWDALANAEYYHVYVDNVQTAKVYETSYELKLSEGSYELKVNAKLSTGFSNYSNVLVYYSDGSNYEGEKIQLSTPKLTLENNTLSWTKVNHAASYKLYENNVLLTETTELSYDIELVAGNTYYVVAIGDNTNYLNSNKSNVITIEEKEPDSGNPDTGNPDTGGEPEIVTNGVINIFSINDTHGAIITDSEVTGLDKVQTVIKSLESSTSYIKVANGDIFQGGYASNVTRGKIFVETLNAMDFDCFVIGNHEFDWGIETISVYNDGILENGEADFPFLGANIVYKSSSTMPEWMEQYTIVENNGLTIGIIGVIGQGLTSSILADNVANYSFLDPVPIVEKLSKKLRTEEGCDSVIVAIHEYEEDTNQRFAQLSGDSRVDGILCAHTHQKINQTVSRNDGYKIPVLQSQTKNITVGYMNLTYDNGAITKTNVTHVYPNNYQSDQEILNVINKYSDIIAEGESKIGYTASSLSKSSLGNLAANALRDYGNGDFGVLNTGGVRATIGAGDILMKEIFEVFPFDNRLVEVTMTGKQLLDFYNTADGYCYFSDNFKSSNIVSTKTYKLIVIDYVYTYSYYKKYFNNVPATYLDSYIRDAVIDALK